MITRFEEYLRENLPRAPSFHPHYERALAEMLLAGGKRFRPALIFAVCGGIDASRLELAFAPALAIEMLHTYSLIHDDLPAMDNADLRRGHPTLHKTYNEVTAILVGDALNTHAFSSLARAPIEPEILVELIGVLAENGGANGMVLGQALDCHFEGAKLTLEQVEFVHTHKTAKLIAAAMQMGALIARGERELCEKLYALGLKLGLFFQIRDDIIDVISDEQSAGKTVGHDSGKNSFVNLLGLEGAQTRLHTLGSEIRAAISALPYNLPATLGDAVGRLR